MNPKVLFLLMIAGGCAAVAAVAGSQLANAPKSGVPEKPMIEIVVAASDVDVATKISGEKFKLAKFPENSVPEGAIKVLQDVEGKFTNQRMYTGEPLLERKVMNSTDSVATKIPDGYRVFDIPAGDSTYIKPGDRVDVVGYFEKSSKISETKTIKVLENVTVLMVDGVAVRELDDAGKHTAKTIQLLVRDNQYESLTTAANLGKLRLALCGLQGGDESKMTDDGEAFLEWVADTVRKDIKPIDDVLAIPPASMPVATAAPAQPPPAEEYQIVVYSGSAARQFRWRDGEMPAEVGQASQPQANPGVMVAPAAPVPATNSPPTGIFTGETAGGEAREGDWKQTTLKSDKDSADPSDDMTW